MRVSQFLGRRSKRHEPADWDREIKQSQNFGSRVPLEEIRKDRWSDGRITRLSDPYQGSCGKEQAEILQEKRSEKCADHCFKYLWTIVQPGAEDFLSSTRHSLTASQPE